MFARIRQGWTLTKTSWGVVRGNPGIVRLPITGGGLALLMMVVFAGPGGALLATDQSDPARQVAGGALVAIGVYMASIAVIYYNVALAAAAHQALGGTEPDLGAARRTARNHVGAIAGWALMSVAVSAVLAVVRTRGSTAGGIVTAIGGAIWSLVTFLVVPVLVFEGLGPVDAAKRSTELVRQRWGQQVTGDLAIGGFAGMAIVVGVLVGCGGIILLASDLAFGDIGGAVLLAVGALIAIGAAVFAGATRGVFGVALYHFVTEDAAVGPFTPADLESVAAAG